MMQAVPRPTAIVPLGGAQFPGQSAPVFCGHEPRRIGAGDAARRGYTLKYRASG